MDKPLLLDAVIQLDELGGGRNAYAIERAVRQFNALLKQAKTFYKNRPDISALDPLLDDNVYQDDFRDAAKRLRKSLELRPPGSITMATDTIALPPDASSGDAADLQEFKEAVALGHRKSALLLAGSLAEALLIVRHPDASERGPGLAELVHQAKKERLFGRDTLRQLETLIDYRDLIHARAAQRNRIALNDARIEHAVMALKQLCADLQDTSLKFG
jgi:hypothetical protein